MPESDHTKFMRRCLDLAIKAEGMTYPNPMVGSVITYNGLIIGEGFHLKAGNPHAEVNAINSVSDKSILNQSILYVNLEPCSHFGATPPCTDLIISYKIPEVVIGTIDTSDKVSGKGLEKLENSGCKVITGILENESRRLNRRFFTFHEKKRPYITLKWAQSADGYIDIRRPKNYSIEPFWITGKPERVLVHKWRAAEQSILVGAGTVRADNPRLNVREWDGIDPVKMILTRSGRLNEKLAVFETNSPVIAYTSNKIVNYRKAVKVLINEKSAPACQILDYLYDAGIQSLLIEGGAEVLIHFIAQGLWDEARIFTGNSYFKDGVKAPSVDGELESKTDFSISKLEVLLNNERGRLKC
jgi:diaminohydroxyphosphoribosylaminopyrimidine deaminase/5-amino-6-(5-phosphoribosylamino)uracil reductase